MGRSLALALLVVTSAHADDDRPAFKIDVAPPAGCTVAAACEARIKLTALGGYHVNGEYPFKFVAERSADVVVDSAKFAKDGETTGTLAIALRAQRAGTHTVTGTFKLSVCTKDVCRIEAPKIKFAVPSR